MILAESRASPGLTLTSGLGSDKACDEGGEQGWVSLICSRLLQTENDHGICPPLVQKDKYASD